MDIFWPILLVILVLAEALTVQLVTIWFAAGALAAAVATWCGAELWIQITLFAVFSAATLIFLRPKLSKYNKSHKQPTNADRCIGQTAVVSEKIDNLHALGRVTLNGVVWTARSTDNSVIEPGTEVIVMKIEGVKLLVATK